VCLRNPFVSTRHCRLRPLTFFPIVAAFSACFGRFDGLGVQDADGRFWIAIQRVSLQLTQRIIDVDQRSITTPFVERGANGDHQRNIRRKQAPFAARAMFGEQRVDDLVHIDPGEAQRRDTTRAVIARRGRGTPPPTALRPSVASPQSCTTAIVSAGAPA